MPVSESELQEQVADYLRLQYPDVLFHSDFGSGIKLTPGQAIKQKRQNGGRRAWPDMFIAHTQKQILEVKGNGILERAENKYLGGLFLELKKEGTRLEATHCKPRDERRGKNGGVYATTHLKEQADILYDLRQHGYCAEFAVGFDEAKRIIDKYLGGK